MNAQINYIGTTLAPRAINPAEDYAGPGEADPDGDVFDVIGVVCDEYRAGRLFGLGGTLLPSANWIFRAAKRRGSHREALRALGACRAAEAYNPVRG